jgi:hypothetical protein
LVRERSNEMARRYFRLRRLILGGLVFAAIAVPVAQAKHGGSGFWTERPVSTQVSAATGRGFDWTDAGIGAAVVFGAAALLLAAVALGRRFRSHAHPAGIAQG